MTDRELLARLRDGDASAFDAIFRTWYAPLVRFGEGMLRDRGAAEEIAQDVMLELWRRRAALAPDGTAQAYLFQAARNRALNHLRHLRVVERGEAHAADELTLPPPADHAAAEAEIDAAVRAAVASLPPRCREVFELSRVHRLRYAEIAATLGVSVKAVEAQMGKALRVLRTRLSAWLPEED